MIIIIIGSIHSTTCLTTKHIYKGRGTRNEEV